MNKSYNATNARILFLFMHLWLKISFVLYSHINLVQKKTGNFSGFMFMLFQAEQ